MEIKPAILEDAEAILALQRLAYQSEAAIYDDFTIPPLTETLEELQGRFEDRRYLKAIDGGRIVGAVRAFQDTAAGMATCHVERLIVHPEFRRQGIGTALLRMIETCFPAARRCELFTGHKSESNIRLYERTGYRAVRQEQVNERVRLIFMEKTAGGGQSYRPEVAGEVPQERADRPACPICGGQLLDIRRKLCCVRCHSIIETCCD
jgi:ribosomal protein S18 acetylase RimI-like enzyme